MLHLYYFWMINGTTWGKFHFKNGYNIYLGSLNYILMIWIIIPPARVLQKGGLQHASSFKVEVMKEAKAPITDHQNRDVDADADADSDADPRSRSCSRSEERGVMSVVFWTADHRLQLLVRFLHFVAWQLNASMNGTAYSTQHHTTHDRRSQRSTPCHRSQGKIRPAENHFRKQIIDDPWVMNFQELTEPQ